MPGIPLPLLSMVEGWPKKVNRPYRAIWLVGDTACVASGFGDYLAPGKMERVGGNRATGARWLLFLAPWLAAGSSRLKFSWWLRLRCLPSTRLPARLWLLASDLRAISSLSSYLWISVLHSHLHLPQP